MNNWRQFVKYIVFTVFFFFLRRLLRSLESLREEGRLRDEPKLGWVGRTFRRLLDAQLTMTLASGFHFMELGKR